MSKRTVTKSADTGRFVSEAGAAESPGTTYRQTVSGGADPARTAQESLAHVLALIELTDGHHDARNQHVVAALPWALAAGYRAGVRIDPAEPEWPVAFIELPTGQVSWHLPQHPTPWDGHTTEEKYARCRAYADMVWPDGAIGSPPATPPREGGGT